MSLSPAWIAVDWGTSTLRAWAMTPDDTALAEARSDRGMGALGPTEFEPALSALLSDWQVAPDTPVIACGMVGARQGWAEAGYRAVPCAPMGGPLTAAGDRLRTRIVPGLTQSDPPDVMRGEETQIAGFLSRHPDFDGTLCLPGSHTKWVQVSAGEVVSFRTAMTGELFAAISQHTILRHTLTGGWDDAAFADAVSDGLSRPEAQARRLFGLRARTLVGEADPAALTARASGLLIGAELADMRPYWLGTATAVIGTERLAARYAAALGAQGAEPEIADADACTRAGLAAARRLAAA